MSRKEPATSLRVLLIDDDPSDRALVIAELNNAFAEIEVHQVFDSRGLNEAMDRSGYSLVITDFHLLWTDGLAVVREVKSRHPATPVIMFTGTGNEEIAVEAMKSGIEDYVVKSPRHFARLSLSARQAITRGRERETIIRIEQAIKEVEQRYRTFIENFNGIVFKSDLDFNPLYLHGRVREITGYTQGEILSGKPGWKGIIHPVCKERVQNDRERIRTHAAYACESEYRLIRKDGKVKWVREVLQNICSREGVPELIQGIIYDIDEKKTMEESLRRSESLALLGRMVSVVAHELNNPLANIAVCAGALKSRVEEPDSVNPGNRDLFMGYLETVVDETMRCKNIIGDLLDMVRSRALNKGAVDLAEVIRLAVRLLTMGDGLKSYTFEVRTEENLPKVESDTDQLRQVITILLNNAVEAMPGGTGRVSIVCERSADEDALEIAVSDEGQGVPDDLRDKIFEPFFTTKSHKKGTGLGLSIAESIVSGMGGKIGLRPSNGGGATFFIRFPKGILLPRSEGTRQGERV